MVRVLGNVEVIEVVVVVEDMLARRRSGLGGVRI